MENVDLEFLRSLDLVQGTDDAPTPCTPSGSDWIDVRGPFPVYHTGLIAIPLENADRGISVQKARVLVAQ